MGRRVGFLTSRDGRPTNINVKQAHGAPVRRKRKRKLRGECALSHSALARQNENLVLDAREVIGDLRYDCRRGGIKITRPWATQQIACAPGSTALPAPAAHADWKKDNRS